VVLTCLNECVSHWQMLSMSSLMSTYVVWRLRSSLGSPSPEDVLGRVESYKDAAVSWIVSVSRCACVSDGMLVTQFF